MAEDNRPTPPDKSSGPLSRPLPGSGGLTPAQIRRGFLPADTSFPVDPSQPVDDQDKPAGADVTADSQDGPGLPRRVPGTSAIQRPPPADRGTASAGPTAAARKPGPEQLAASAARLRRPKMVMPKADAKRGDSPTSAKSAWTVAPAPTQANAQTTAEAAAPTPAQATAPVAGESAVAPQPLSPHETEVPASEVPASEVPASEVPASEVPASVPAETNSPAANPSPPTAESSPAEAERPPTAGASSGGPAAQPSRGSHLRSSRRARRWQLAGLLVVIAAVLAAMLAIALSHRHPANPRGSMRPVSGEFMAARGASHP
jgi:hypothetical protein